MNTYYPVALTVFQIDALRILLGETVSMLTHPRMIETFQAIDAELAEALKSAERDAEP